MVRTSNMLAGAFAAAMLAAGTAGPVHALDLGIFGDLGLIKTENGNASFRLGHLDFYASQRIDDRTHALFEMEVLTGNNTFDIEIQRFYIMRDISDDHRIGIGRFHTPIGWWSRQFHHGKLLKPTVTRPFILGFERSANSIVPMHLIGLMAEGDIAWDLQYELGIANSNTINTGPGGGNRTLVIPNRADLSDSKSAFARLSHDAFGTPFKPGISFMVNDVLESAADTDLSGPAVIPCPGTVSVQGPPCKLLPRGETLVRQTLIGLDLRYDYRGFHLLAEGFRLENDAQPGVGDGGKHTAYAWFVQLSYDLAERLLATVRHERLDYDDDDPYFTHPRLLNRGVNGTDKRDVAALRYDLSESNALKLEVSKRPRALGQGGYTSIFSWEFVLY